MKTFIGKKQDFINNREPGKFSKYRVDVVTKCHILALQNTVLVWTGSSRTAPTPPPPPPLWEFANRPDFKLMYIQTLVWNAGPQSFILVTQTNLQGERLSEELKEGKNFLGTSLIAWRPCVQPGNIMIKSPNSGQLPKVRTGRPNRSFWK